MLICGGKMTVSNKAKIIAVVIFIAVFILGFIIGNIVKPFFGNQEIAPVSVEEEPSEEIVATPESDFAYLVGNATMNNLKKEYMGIFHDENVVTNAMKSLIKGVTDSNDGIEVPEEKSSEIQDAFRKRVQEIDKMIAERNIVAAEEFLSENKKREGVIETESGLQYEIIRQGGGSLAGKDADVVVDYVMAAGSEDNVVDKGEDVPMLTANLISGVSEGIALMNTGSQFKFYIHPRLGYSTASLQDIPPNSLLIFTVTLKKINTTQEENK